MYLNIKNLKDHLSSLFQKQGVNKSIDSLVKEKIKVKQHLRSEHGKVSTVKQHMREQEINPDKKAVSTIHPNYTDINQFVNSLKNIPINELTPDKIVSTYKLGENTIVDLGMQKNKWNIAQIFDLFSSAMSYDKKYTSDTIKNLLNQNTVKNIISSPDYMNKISKHVDDIEKFFNDTLNINTQRLTPFTFKFQHVEKNITLINKNKFQSNMMNILSNANIHLLPMDKHNFLKEMNFLADTIDMALNPFNPEKAKPLSQYLIPYSIFNTVRNTTHNSISNAFNLKKLNNDEYRDIENLYISTNFRSLTNSQNEDRRKLLRDFIKQSPALNQNKELSQTLRYLTPQQVKPFIDWIISKKTIPSKELMNKIFNPIVKLASNLVNNAYHNYKEQSGDSHDIYVSKNPMEFLTMSPSGNFESCQSLCNLAGEHNITSFNANLLSAAYAHHNTDFIMFSSKNIANKSEIFKLEKSARVTFNLDKEKNKFNSLENSKIYSSSFFYKKILQGVVDKISPHVYTDEEPDLGPFLEKFSEIPKDVFKSEYDEFEKLNNQFIENIKNKDVKKSENNFRNMRELYDSVNTYKKSDYIAKTKLIPDILNNIIKNIIESDNQPMSYISDFHRALLGNFGLNSDNIFTHMETNKSKLATYMSEKIKNHENVLSIFKSKSENNAISYSDFIERISKNYDTNSEFETSFDSLVKEKIKVKQHLRSEHGKVSTVKQHMREQEVNPDKDIHNQDNDLDKYVNAMSKINLDTATFKDIIDVYKSGFNSIYDSGMEKKGWKLEDIFKEYGETLFPVTDTKEAKDFISELTDWNNIRKNLTSHDFIKRISERVDILESFFNDNLGLKTERIDPFSFRILHGGKKNHEINYEKFMKNLSNIFKSKEIMNNNEDWVETNEHIKNFITSAGTELNNDIFNEVNFSDKYSAYITRRILVDKPKDIENKYNIKKIKYNDLRNMTNSFIDFGDQIKFNKITDGEIIRKGLKKLFSEDVFKDYPELNKVLKKLKPTQINGQLSIVENLGSIVPSEYMDDIFDPVKNLFKKELNRSKQTDNRNSNDIGDYVYITKNPFEFLTMSPSGNFESCQSVCNSHGEINISSMNYNLFNVGYTDKNNDFLITTVKKTKNGIEKVSRISLNYNEDKNKILSYENGMVYGRNSRIISNFIEEKIGKEYSGYSSYEDRYQLTNSIKENGNKRLHDSVFSTKLSYIYNDIKKSIENHDKDNFKKNMNELNKLKNIYSRMNNPLVINRIYDKLYKGQKNDIISSINSGKYSMLYTGDFHTFISNGMELNKSRIMGYIHSALDNFDSYIDRLKNEITELQNKSKTIDKVTIKVFDSLVKEEIRVKQHLRKEKGKTSVVKEHKRLQEVNPDKDIHSIDKYIDNINKINPESFNIKDLVNIYKSGFDSIYDSGMEKNGWKLDNAYSLFKVSMNITNDQNKLNFFEKLIGWDNVKKNLLSPEFIRNTSQKIDILERFFNDNLGLKTERIDPFSFRTLHGEKKAYATNQEWFFKEYNNIIEKAKLLDDDLYYERNFITRSNIDSINDMDNLINSHNKTPENITKDIIFRFMNKIMNVYDRKIEKEYISKEIDRKDTANIAIPFDDMIDKINLNGITDGEIIRKEAKKLFTNDEFIKKYPELNKTLKQLTPTEVKPWLNIIRIFRQIPSAEFAHNVITPISNLIKKNIDRSKQTKHDELNEEDYAYITKNPMEFLTMSPSGNFESCQSICDSEGNISISLMNYNLMSAAHTDKNNDFLITTIRKTKNGYEKTSRISLNYDDVNSKIKSYEACSVYGNKKYNDILRKFVHNNMVKKNTYTSVHGEEMMKDSNEINKTIRRSCYPILFESKLEKTKDDIEESIKNYDVDGFKKGMNRLNKFKNSLTKLQDYKNRTKVTNHIYKNAINIQNNEVSKKIDSGKWSMLYHGDIHNFINNGMGYSKGEIFDLIHNIMRDHSNQILSTRKSMARKQNERRKQIKSSNNMEIRKSINALMKKEIRVKQHLRKEEGKVSTVREHKRLQEVNPDKKLEQIGISKQMTADDIAKRLSEINIDSANGKDFVDAYSTEGHTIHDTGLEKSEQDLKTYYEEFIHNTIDLPEIFFRPNINKELHKDILNNLFNWDSIKKKLSSKEYASNISKRVDEIEKFFNETLGIKTERKDPFGFTFSVSSDANFVINDRKITDKLVETLEKHIDPALVEKQRVRNSVIDSELMTKSLVKDLSDKNENSTSKQQRDFFPLQLFRETMGNYRDELKDKYDIMRLGTGYYDRVLKMKDNDIINQDAEKMRKNIKSYFNNDDLLKDAHVLNKTLKQLKPHQILPQYKQLQHTGDVLSNDLMNDIYDPIREFGLNASRQYDKFIKDNGNMIQIYISKNPFELLTMSPSGNFESCQSLTDKDGKSSVSSNNANMINAIYGEHNNDFIMFTTRKTDKGLEKSARASLSLNKNTNKLDSFENFKVYYSDRLSRETIDNFFERKEVCKNYNSCSSLGNEHKSRYDTIVNQNDVLLKKSQEELNLPDMKKIKEFVNTLNDQYHNNDLNGINDTVKEIDNFDDIVKKRNDTAERKESLKTIYVNNFNKLFSNGESILYNSPMHNYIIDSHSDYLDKQTKTANESLLNLTAKIRQRVDELKKRSSGSNRILFSEDFVPSIDSLVKEEIRVKQHLRSEHGKISTIKEHKRLQEVNPDKNDNKNIDDINDIINKLSNVNLVKTNGKEIVDIYKMNGHSIYDDGMEKRGQDIKNIYNDYVSCLNKDVPYNAIINDIIGQNKVGKVLCSSEYVSGISNRVNDIEEFFNNKLGFNTERINPFTFRFPIKSDIKTFNPNIEKIYNKINDILKSNVNLENMPQRKNLVKNAVNLVLNSINNELMIYNLDDNDFIENISDICKDTLPRNLFSTIYSTYKKEIQTKYNIETIDKNITSRIRDGFRNKRLYMMDNPEDVRKELKELFNKDDNLKSITKLNRTLKYLKPQQIERWISHIKATDEILPNDLMNDIYDPLLKIGSNINEQFIKFINDKNKQDYMIYISKNPMEFLTMSPSGNFESCQSITREDGRFTIGSFNANIINSAYSHINNDFIMYTTRKTDKGLEKSARTSINYNKEKSKLDSYEKFKVYGSNDTHRNVLIKFLESENVEPHTNLIFEGEKYKITEDIDELSNDILDAAKNKILSPYINRILKLNNALKEQEKNNDNVGIIYTKNKINKLSQAITNTSFKVYNKRAISLAHTYADFFKKLMSNDKYSMLYSSPIHNCFISNGCINKINFYNEAEDSDRRLFALMAKIVK